MNSFIHYVHSIVVLHNQSDLFFFGLTFLNSLSLSSLVVVKDEVFVTYKLNLIRLNLVRKVKDYA